MIYFWLDMTTIIEYKNTKVHSNADGLSRLPLKTEERAEEVVDPVNVFNMMQFEPLPITVDNVRRETQRDPDLSQVHEMPCSCTRPLLRSQG